MNFTYNNSLEKLRKNAEQQLYKQQALERARNDRSSMMLSVFDPLLNKRAKERVQEKYGISGFLSTYVMGTVDLFNNTFGKMFTNPAEGIINSLTCIGDSMDVLSNVIKVPIISSVRGEAIGDTFLNAYGLGENGRIAVNMSELREEYNVGTGVVSGTLAGTAIGGKAAGPIGMGIGAAIGAVVGLTAGSLSKLSEEDPDNKMLGILGGVSNTAIDMASEFFVDPTNWYTLGAGVVIDSVAKIDATSAKAFVINGKSGKRLGNSLFSKFNASTRPEDHLYALCKLPDKGIQPKNIVKNANFIRSKRLFKKLRTDIFQYGKSEKGKEKFLKDLITYKQTSVPRAQAKKLFNFKTDEDFATVSADTVYKIYDQLVNSVHYGNAWKFFQKMYFLNKVDDAFVKGIRATSPLVTVTLLKKSFKFVNKRLNGNLFRFLNHNDQTYLVKLYNSIYDDKDIQFDYSRAIASDKAVFNTEIKQLFNIDIDVKTGAPNVDHLAITKLLDEESAKFTDIIKESIKNKVPADKTALETVAHKIKLLRKCLTNCTVKLPDGSTLAIKDMTFGLNTLRKKIRQVKVFKTKFKNIPNDNFKAFYDALNKDPEFSNIMNTFLKAAQNDIMFEALSELKLTDDEIKILSYYLDTTSETHNSITQAYIKGLKRISKSIENDKSYALKSATRAGYLLTDLEKELQTIVKEASSDNKDIGQMVYDLNRKIYYSKELSSEELKFISDNNLSEIYANINQALSNMNRARKAYKEHNALYNKLYRASNKTSDAIIFKTKEEENLALQKYLPEGNEFTDYKVIERAATQALAQLIKDGATVDNIESKIDSIYTLADAVSASVSQALKRDLKLNNLRSYYGVYRIIKNFKDFISNVFIKNTTGESNPLFNSSVVEYKNLIKAIPSKFINKEGVVDPEFIDALKGIIVRISYSKDNVGMSGVVSTLEDISSRETPFSLDSLLGSVLMTQDEFVEFVKRINSLLYDAETLNEIHSTKLLNNALVFTDVLASKSPETKYFLFKQHYSLRYCIDAITSPIGLDSLYHKQGMTYSGFKGIPFKDIISSLLYNSFSYSKDSKPNASYFLKLVDKIEKMWNKYELAFNKKYSKKFSKAMEYIKQYDALQSTASKEEILDFITKHKDLFDASNRVKSRSDLRVQFGKEASDEIYRLMFEDNKEYNDTLDELNYLLDALYFENEKAMLFFSSTSLVSVKPSVVDNRVNNNFLVYSPYLLLGVPVNHDFMKEIYKDAGNNVPDKINPNFFTSFLNSFLGTKEAEDRQLFNLSEGARVLGVSDVVNKLINNRTFVNVVRNNIVDNLFDSVIHSVDRISEMLDNNDYDYNEIINIINYMSKIFLAYDRGVNLSQKLPSMYQPVFKQLMELANNLDGSKVDNIPDILNNIKSSVSDFLTADAEYRRRFLVDDTPLGKRMGEEIKEMLENTDLEKRLAPSGRFATVVDNSYADFYNKEYVDPKKLNNTSNALKKYKYDAVEGFVEQPVTYSNDYNPLADTNSLYYFDLETIGSEDILQLAMYNNDGKIVTNCYVYNPEYVPVNDKLLNRAYVDGTYADNTLLKSLIKGDIGYINILDGNGNVGLLFKNEQDMLNYVTQSKDIDLGSHTLVGYNSNTFDMDVLGRAISRNGVKMPDDFELNSIDILPILRSTAINGSILLKQEKLEAPVKQTLENWFTILKKFTDSKEAGDQHNAVEDVRQLVQIANVLELGKYKIVNNLAVSPKVHEQYRSAVTATATQLGSIEDAITKLDANSDDYETRRLLEAWTSDIQYSYDEFKSALIQYKRDPNNPDSIRQVIGTYTVFISDVESNGYDLEDINKTGGDFIEGISGRPSLKGLSHRQRLKIAYEAEKLKYNTHLSKATVRYRNNLKIKKSRISRYLHKNLTDELLESDLDLLYPESVITPVVYDTPIDEFKDAIVKSTEQMYELFKLDSDIATSLYGDSLGVIQYNKSYIKDVQFANLEANMFEINEIEALGNGLDLTLYSDSTDLEKLIMQVKKHDPKAFKIILNNNNKVFKSIRGLKRAYTFRKDIMAYISNALYEDPDNARKTYSSIQSILRSVDNTIRLTRHFQVKGYNKSDLATEIMERLNFKQNVGDYAPVFEAIDSKLDYNYIEDEGLKDILKNYIFDVVQHLDDYDIDDLSQGIANIRPSGSFVEQVRSFFASFIDNINPDKFSNSGKVVTDSGLIKTNVMLDQMYDELNIYINSLRSNLTDVHMFNKKIASTPIHEGQVAAVYGMSVFDIIRNNSVYTFKRLGNLKERQSQREVINIINDGIVQYDASKAMQPIPYADTFTQKGKLVRSISQFFNMDYDTFKGYVKRAYGNEYNANRQKFNMKYYEECVVPYISQIKIKDPLNPSNEITIKEFFDNIISSFSSTDIDAPFEVQKEVADKMKTRLTNLYVELCQEAFPLDTVFKTGGEELEPLYKKSLEHIRNFGLHSREDAIKLNAYQQAIRKAVWYNDIDNLKAIVEDMNRVFTIGTKKADSDFINLSYHYGSKQKCIEGYKSILESNTNTLNQLFGNDYNAMYSFIKSNPDDYKLVAIVPTTDYVNGVMCKRLEVSSPEELRIALTNQEYKFSILDEHTIRTIQNDIGQKGRNYVPHTTFGRNMARYRNFALDYFVRLFKSLGLLNVGYTVTNFVENLFKSITALGDDGVTAITNYKDAVVLHKKWYDMRQQLTRALYGSSYYNDKDILDAFDKELVIAEQLINNKVNPKDLINGWDNLSDKQQKLILDRAQKVLEVRNGIGNNMRREEFREVDTFLRSVSASSDFENIKMYSEDNKIGDKTTSEKSTLKHKIKTKVDNTYKKLLFSNGIGAINYNNLKLNSDIETVGRLSMYLSTIRRGDTVNEALNKVLTTHFNYNNKSSLELYAELLFPYISFPIRTLNFWYNSFVEYPAMTKAIIDMMFSNWGEDIYNPYNQYGVSRGNIKLGNTGYSFSSGISFGDAFHLSGNPIQTLYRKANPVLQIAANTTGLTAIITGRSSNVNYALSRLPLASQGSTLLNIYNHRNELNPNILLPSVINRAYKQDIYSMNKSPSYRLYSATMKARRIANQLRVK